MWSVRSQRECERVSERAREREREIMRVRARGREKERGRRVRMTSKIQ